MRICGLNKTTLLDYPGRVAATVFLDGCNFRCPFCQNGSLVVTAGTEPEIKEEELLTFLKKRRGILEGVCITGGEPTINRNLGDLLDKIKNLGYDIKLDTNGSNPELLKALVKDGLVDMVAMDIKSCLRHYGKLIGRENYNTYPIAQSADFLLGGSLPYEFRTTVAEELHDKADFYEIADWLGGAKAYYLQAYRDSEAVICPGLHSCSYDRLKEYQEILRQKISLVEIRGIDE